MYHKARCCVQHRSDPCPCFQLQSEVTIIFFDPEECGRSAGLAFGLWSTLQSSLFSCKSVCKGRRHQIFWPLMLLVIWAHSFPRTEQTLVAHSPECVALLLQ